MHEVQAWSADLAERVKRAAEAHGWRVRRESVAKNSPPGHIPSRYITLVHSCGRGLVLRIADHPVWDRPSRATWLLYGKPHKAVRLFYRLRTTDQAARLRQPARRREVAHV